MNELSPIVAFDRKLGEHVDYIDIDYDQLVDYMQERGFDDDTIKDTDIMISAEAKSKKHKKSGTENLTFGAYDKKTDEINIYPRSDIAVRQPMYDYYSEHDDKDIREMMVSETDKSLSNSVSRTLGHEIEHKLIKYEGGMKQEKMYQAKKLGKQAMYVFGTSLAVNYGYREVLEIWGMNTSGIVNSASTWLASASLVANVHILAGKYGPGAAKKKFQEYKNAPEEKRCREVEQSTPDIVTIKALSKADKLA